MQLGWTVLLGPDPNLQRRQETSILRKTLTILQASAVVIGAVVGIGIFKTPSVVAANVTSEATFLGLYLLGGVVTLIAMPNSGRHIRTSGANTISCGRRTAPGLASCSLGAAWP
jgi:hypothetical protein